LRSTSRVFAPDERTYSDARLDTELATCVSSARPLVEGQGRTAMLQDLEDLLGTQVDVLSDGGVSPHLRERVYAEAVPL
jgi:predicted nucleotidyltransferase